MSDIDESDDLEGSIETTQPGGGMLIRERGTKEVYLWADAAVTVDVESLQ
jgi:hypothetical protein